MRQGVLLLDELPELAELLDEDQAAAARATLAVPALELPTGPCHRAAISDGGSEAFAAIVLDGLITRHVGIGGQPALQLHGPGDVLGAQPFPETLLDVEDELRAAIPTRLAVIDDHFLVAARRWPRLITGLFRQTQDQSDRLLLQLAIAEQPKVEQRLLTLFWHLADRFGHVTPDGIVVCLGLTHQALGRLIGARRPTVTLALRALAERGAVWREDDRRWTVAHLPTESAAALTAAVA